MIHHSFILLTNLQLTYTFNIIIGENHVQVSPGFFNMFIDGVLRLQR